MVEQELLTFPEHQRSLPVSSGIHVAQSLVFCVFLKSDSTHHFFGNACSMSGSLRFFTFPVVDWFCLFIYLWVLTLPLEDCSEFGNFVITLICRLLFAFSSFSFLYYIAFFFFFDLWLLITCLVSSKSSSLKSSRENIKHASFTQDIVLYRIVNTTGYRMGINKVQNHVLE